MNRSNELFMTCRRGWLARNRTSKIQKHKNAELKYTYRFGAFEARRAAKVECLRIVDPTLAEYPWGGFAEAFGKDPPAKNRRNNLIK